jgi:hypothetical protein
MPAYTERLTPTLPDPNAFTPGIRALALELAARYPGLRIDSIGIRDDGSTPTLMLDLSITLTHPLTDPDLLAELGAWQEAQIDLIGLA